MWSLRITSQWWSGVSKKRILDNEVPGLIIFLCSEDRLQCLEGEMCPHQLVYLNTWFPAGGVLCGRLLNLKEVQSCWRKHTTGGGLWGFIVSPPLPILVYTWNVTSQLPVPAAMPCFPHHCRCSLWSHGWNKLFLPKSLFGPGVWLHQQKSNWYLAPPTKWTLSHHHTPGLWEEELRLLWSSWASGTFVMYAKEQERSEGHTPVSSFLELFVSPLNRVQLFLRKSTATTKPTIYLICIWSFPLVFHQDQPRLIKLTPGPNNSFLSKNYFIQFFLVFLRQAQAGLKLVK